ncbi:hypothetical protein JCM14467A_01660 [Vulcanisaeta sp. JCM 14467]
MLSGALNTVLNIAYRLGLMKRVVARLSPMPTKPQPLALPATAYVVGPGQFISGLVSAGAPESMIKPITLGDLASVPNDSIIIIDWDYVNETMHVNINQLAKLLGNVISRGDLLILYAESPRWVLPLEDAVAVAWGNYFHSIVIGYPVVAVNASTYLVAFGGRNYLVVNPVQVGYDYTAAINELMRYWLVVGEVRVGSAYLMSPGSTVTLYDQDACPIVLEQVKAYNLSEWVFTTGPTPEYGNLTGDEYVYDYCITGIYPSARIVTSSIPVEYLGFNNLEAGSSGGDWVDYVVGVNMTTAYHIDQERGYNSYMAWVLGGGAQPYSTSCKWFMLSAPQMSVLIGQEVLQLIYYAKSMLNSTSPVYSLAPSLIITSPGPEGAANLIWSIGVKNQNWFCMPVPTQAGYEYPVGFGVTDAQGAWYLNPSRVNTAASPVLYGEGTICYPPTSGYIVEDFFSEVYFIIQYNPSATYTINPQSYEPGPGTYITNLYSPTCPNYS